MFHRFYTPTPLLSPFIASFWLHQSDPQQQAHSRVFPTGTAQLVIDLSGDGLNVPNHATTSRTRDTFSALLHGVDTAYFPLETDRPLLQFGVDFHPGGLHPFFTPPTSELQNAHIPLDALWNRQAVDELRERLAKARSAEERVHIIERTLLRQLARPLALHRAVAQALQVFSLASQRPSTARIAQVAEHAGLSPGGFTRIFREEVGLTPKLFARVRRFRWLLRRAKADAGQRVNWARLAAECGYYDQAHLIKEFQAFAGISPSVYLRNRDARSPTTHLLAA